VAPFSALTAPKPDIAPSTVARAQLVTASQSRDTVQQIYASHLIPSNIVALSIHDIEKLTPQQ
ncbi:hypothetical protein, partial [Undibacterium sp. 10I3]